MSAQQSQQTETVLVIGATGNIGIAAIQGALFAGRNVIAAVRNQNSAKKLQEHITEGHDRITTVEVDITSAQGVQSIVDKARAEALPSFQHVYTCAGGEYTSQSLLDSTLDDIHQYLSISFDANFSAYRATIPYLLEQKGRDTSFTSCTGSQGEVGEKFLPAISQGALFSMYTHACGVLRGTNVRFNEVYLAMRVEVDSDAEQHGVTKASDFGRVYQQLLERSDIRSTRVRVESEQDISVLRYQQK